MQFLKERLEQSFDPRSKERGEEYFRSGRVRLQFVDADSAVAEVNGGDLYDVSFEEDDAGVIASCSCPRAEEGFNCKHMWATILAIEARQEKRQHRSSRGPTWKRELSVIHDAFRDDMFRQQKTPPSTNRRVFFWLDLEHSNQTGSPAVILEVQSLSKSGAWGQPRRSYTVSALDLLLGSADPNERLIGQLLGGAQDDNIMFGMSPLRRTTAFYLSAEQVDPLLRLIAQTGRFARRASENQNTAIPLKVDLDQPWRFILHDEPVENEPENFYLTGSFVRGDETIAIGVPLLTMNAGFLIYDNTLARLEHAGAWPLVSKLRSSKRWLVHKSQMEPFLVELTRLPRLPPLKFSDALQITTPQGAMKKHLRLERPSGREASSYIYGLPGFEYGEIYVHHGDDKAAKFDGATGALFVRQLDEEHVAVDQLRQAGFEDVQNQRGAMRVHATRLHNAVIFLNTLGWRVEAEGSLYRSKAKIDIRVSSGIDWFELQGAAEFDGNTVALPKLLQAMSKGEKTITLDDGSIGILPEEWLQQYGALAKLGDKSGDVLKFTKAQVGLLDALLATMPDASVDEVFDHARTELRAFSGVSAVEAPESFVGELRPYQKEGLGWLNFLKKFGFGGCLADDMGLGKTVQVLSLLEHERRSDAGPSLVVAPRSLVFNWIEEAKRFCPQLRVLDHSGAERSKTTDPWKQHDLILTTYGTLRRDIQQYQEMEFNYAILDEAQAIKNAGTDSAKAARLVRAKNRLALSGTPVENHIGELWSIFEYLNPGMLGSSGAFKSLIGRETAPDSRRMLAQALRPFILRRTKAQVAKDLPEKTEQTIYCDLDVPQRKLYDELRDYYRAHLLQQIDEVGLNKSKIMVLESLLRLRQAACHPALVDEKHANIDSAKITTLLEQLDDVLQEGHKALVFSQFTSFLSLVREHLDKKQVTYEYLDGKTRDRQARVRRFQDDQACQLFLISLKAGGTGLNLTAADYVFLLDPWWNPAVEAQAIDRTHRIGQTRKVFAYRIIARGTVEERVLELQKSKRELADAIINADNSLISSLNREDLELLLS